VDWYASLLLHHSMRLLQGKEMPVVPNGVYVCMWMCVCLHGQHFAAVVAFAAVLACSQVLWIEDGDGEMKRTGSTVGAYCRCLVEFYRSELACYI
jgi:hypothetical protein